MERQDSIESHTSNPPPPPDPELKILFLYSVFLALDRMHNAYMSIQLEMANIKVDLAMMASSLKRKTGDFHVGLESGPWASESRVAVHRLLFTKGQSPQNIHSKFPFTAAWKPILVIIVQVIFYVFWADFLSSHKSGKGSISSQK